MRYGLDLDGVLANFGAEVVAIGNALWPGKFPHLYAPDNWDYEGQLTKEEWAQIWTVIKATPYFWENETDLPGLARLKEKITPADEVFFITARETTIGEPPSVQSARWLHHRGLWPRAGYSSVLQVEEAKYKQDLFRGLKLKFMLDDYAPTIEQLNKIEGMHAFLLDQPWNRYANELPRVFSVSEYLEKIRTL
jgi:5'(3')-deoxyribonucleotidase